MDHKLKIELAAPNFFAIPLSKVEIENEPGTGRTYFLFKGAIVAVARLAGDAAAELPEASAVAAGHRLSSRAAPAGR